MPEQLSLPVQLPDDETFDGFIRGANGHLVAHLQALVTDPADPDQPFLTYVSGERGSGKSHLLYALCHLAQMQRSSHIYLNLSDFGDLHQQVLLGLEHIDLICLDDLESIVGQHDWQLALFDLINRVKEARKSRLVICACTGPKRLALSLPDLQSRLTWGISFQLQSLSDQDQLSALLKRAQQRGLKMPEAMGHFLLTRMQRDMHSLMQALDKLDKLALQQKRKLTIPFIKQVLGL